MKKFLVTFLLAAFCLLNSQAKRAGFYAPEADIKIFLNNDSSIALIQQVVRFQKYNSWYVYRVSAVGNGDLHLSGVAEVKDASPDDNYVDKRVPEDITISGLATESPSITGKFNSSLTKIVPGYNDRQWEMARSLVYYNENPELFATDSVANLSTNAYALVPSYRELKVQAQTEAKQLKTERDSKTKKTNAWMVSLLLIPFLLSLYLWLTVDYTDIPGKLKAISIVQVIGLAAIIISVHAFNTYWWLIVLAVIMILAIQAINLLLFIKLKNYVNASVGVKYPLLPAFAFGYIGLMGVSGVIGAVIILLSSLRVDTSVSTSEIIVGAVAAIAIVALVGWWYKSALNKSVPELKGRFLPIAVMTLMAAFAILSLILVIIALVIFGHTGKSFINEGRGAESTGDSTRSCATCALNGTFTCPHSRTDGSPHHSCSDWRS